jgi:hypothetical protein
MSSLATVQESNLFVVDPAEAATIAEKVIAENGDLYQLTPIERKKYYLGMCSRYGLDPFSSPFDYLSQKMKDKDGQYRDRITLYPNQRASNFFAQQHHISVTISSKEFADGLWVVTAIAKGRDGRSMEDVGAVQVTERINRGDALKKAISQARRRAVLALCGFSDRDDSAYGTPIAAEAFDPPIDVMEAGVVTIDEPIAFNRQPLMDAITKATKTAGWSRAEGSEYLQRVYHKKTRDELTDAELLDFCEYIEEVARKAQPA